MSRRRSCYQYPAYPMAYPYPVRHMDLTQAYGGTPQMPGTILRVDIPPGMVINLLNLIEVASPQGISLIVRLPFLSGSSACNNLISSLTQAGAGVQPMPPSYTMPPISPMPPTGPMMG